MIHFGCSTLENAIYQPVDVYKIQAIAFYLKDAVRHYEQGYDEIVLALCSIIELLDPTNADMIQLRGDSRERFVTGGPPERP